jgi:serine/threonine protein kinase
VTAAPSPQGELVGAILSRKYTLKRLIGTGGMGSVYESTSPENSQPIAIKVLGSDWLQDEDVKTRFVEEGRTCQRLIHPNIVRVAEVAQAEDGTPYIVMELLDGVPLSRVMKQRLSVAEALTLIGDVLDGVGAAHARGVVHRDLKPGNIFVANGKAVIVDFGFAKLISDPKAPNVSITGEVVGTPAYMAPEQIQAGREVDGRTDLYAVGCVLYEMLANRLPFAGKTALQMMGAHVNQVALPVTAYRPDCPKAVSDAIAKAMSKQPRDRFPDAAAMRRALTLSGRTGAWVYVVLAVVASAIVIGIARALG